ncbi:hypothetical protein N7533_003360 [Penicillium manginii]|uniref:uncharacterized protein n=1 Tax=Penicillium manginii TaxID=203109 RepID=UPI0025477BE9|nr:uncharacterized protein N7533_008429 [Penicillium manginii]XP_056962698.1 uncharacterized protein N7533_003360 [Penicillium manginii]KAJ5743559.1 hypothetical protein N7533_008429 [Penicillium manginii]KAJ5761321.1 hypothetical protein N7533_003360 [Penicillium manginii]
MAETEITNPSEQSPSSPFQNVRTNGRAFESPNWRMKGEGGAPASPSPRASTSRPSFGQRGQTPQAITDGRRLYVGNMPYTAKAEDVEALFTAAEFSIERVDIAVDPFTGRNPSYCFVDVGTKEEAARAMAELDGKELLGRMVRIKPGVQRSSANPGSPSPSTSSGMGMMGTSGVASPSMDRWRRPDQSATAGSSSSSLSTPKTQGDSSRRVYVGGLPRVADQEELQSKVTGFFQGYEVQEVSKLFAPHPAKRFEPGEHNYLFVELASVEEAQRAMDSLNGVDGPWGGPLRVQRARGEQVAK